MAKKWSDLKVGDELLAVADSNCVTEGRRYPVTHVGELYITFINDEGDEHGASEDWVLIPYEEKGDDIMTKSNAGTLEVIVEDVPAAAKVHAGQVRMDDDGVVILVIDAVDGLAYRDGNDMYNTVILCSPDGDLDYNLNAPYRKRIPKRC